MKRLLTILLLFLSLPLLGATYYVSTTGNNGNDGSIGSPWLTWQYGFDNIHAGDILYIRGGTYNITSAVTQTGESGTSTSRITVSAYGTEVPILNCTGVTSPFSEIIGIRLSYCDYWNLTGLTVQGTPDAAGKRAYGFYLEESDYITHTNCVSRWNQGPGFAINGFCDFSIYIKCDSYSNYDDLTGGEHADGFIASHYGSSGGYHTQYYYCRAWNNSDDGYDRLTSDGDKCANDNRGGYFIWDNCWSWGNGYGASGDGWGFKLESVSGSEIGSPTQQTLRNCLAFDNAMGGVSTWWSCAKSVLYNNTIYRNASQGFYSEDNSTASIFRNNICYDNGGSAYVDQANFVDDHNTWNSISVDNADFVSLDTAGVSGARDINGNLPNLDFLKLVEGSNLIDKGYDVQLLYEGFAPDLGAFEWGYIAPITIPTVTTTVITNIGATTATTGGNITDDGGVAVTARGVCYSTSPSPLITGLKTTDGSGIGAYVSNLTGLALTTTYYVRAYATNSEGTGYGTQRSFTTGGSVSSGELIKHTGKLVKQGSHLIKVE